MRLASAESWPRHALPSTAGVPLLADIPSEHCSSATEAESSWEAASPAVREQTASTAAARLRPSTSALLSTIGRSFTCTGIYTRCTCHAGICRLGQALHHCMRCCQTLKAKQ